jgi:hypothetical protein
MVQGGVFDAMRGVFGFVICSDVLIFTMSPHVLSL